MQDKPIAGSDIHIVIYVITLLVEKFTQVSLNFFFIPHASTASIPCFPVEVSALNLEPTPGGDEGGDLLSLIGDVR